jgi:hypothetical protein
MNMDSDVLRYGFGVIVFCLIFAAAVNARGLDYNDDGIVDGRDFAIFANQYGSIDQAYGAGNFLGMWYFSRQWLCTPPSIFSMADYNQNGVVDIQDFATFILYAQQGDARADLNLDGSVDDVDWAIMCQNWLAHIVTAGNWYVDPVNGSDDNPGTAAHPWASIARAQSTYKLQAGQSGLVRGGDTVVLVTSDPCASFGDFVENIAHPDYIIYKSSGLIPAHIGKIDLGYSSTNLSFEGVYVNNYCDLSGTTNVRLVNSKVIFGGRRYDAPSVLIGLNDACNVQIQHCEIANCKNGLIGSNCNYITLANNNIHGISEDAMDLTKSNNVVLLQNHIHDLHHDEKVYKGPYVDPVGFKPAQPGVNISDVVNYDTAITASSPVAAGLLAYVTLPDTPESGAYTASGDFSVITSLELYFISNVTIYRDDLAIRVSSSTDCNSGDCEDILIENYDASSNDSNQWAWQVYQPYTSNYFGTGQLDDSPHFDQVWDTSVNPPVLKAQLAKGHSIGRFNSSNQARSVGIVLKRAMGPFWLRLDVSQQFYFSTGAHQDFIAVSGENWQIKDNICHDGMVQGLFSTDGILSDLAFEQNLFYNFYSVSLTNLTVGGNSRIAYNTLIGYARPMFNGAAPYPTNSPNYFSGSANIIVSDPFSDDVKVYNNLVAGTLAIPYSYSRGVPDTTYWDYNIVQASSDGIWGMPPWPCYSARITDASSTATFNDFFVTSNFTQNDSSYRDFRLQPDSGKIPCPVNFATLDLPMPPKGLGTLDQDNAFILDNGIPRDANHHSAGAYEYGQ